METKPLTVRLIELDAATGRITEAEYAQFQNWWMQHGWQAVPANVLPKCGVVVTGKVDMAAGWLYMDNSVGVSMLEWVVTNPSNAPRDSLKALKVLMQTVKAVAAEHGYTVILTSAKNSGLIKLYEREGFVPTDTGVTHLIHVL